VKWRRAAAVACDVAAFVLPLLVYAFSASSEPGEWDTAELQGVPYILGIAHPTGFPFYTLIGYAWSHVALLGTVAWRMNVMSGVAIAVACATGYALARRLGARRWIALPATLWFAFVNDVWAHAARAEAQDVALACETVAVYAFVRWMQGGRAGWFVASFALTGLGMAAHPQAVWLVPASIVGTLIARQRPSFGIAVKSVGALLAGIALYLYLPLRSAYVVAHNLDPTRVLANAGGGVFWNYNDPSTPSGLLAELTGKQSGAPSYFLSSLNPLHVQSTLWAFIQGFNQQYGTFALLVAFVGFLCWTKRDWRTALFACIACLAGLTFSVAYAAKEADIGRYQMLAWWLGVPMLSSAAPRWRKELWPALARIALAIFLLAGAGISLYQQRNFFKRVPGEGGRWVIDAVRPYVKSGDVLVAPWLDVTSLAYGAYVDRSLPGVIIVSDDRQRIWLYRPWARTHRVFVLANPQYTPVLPGTTFYKPLDDYHELLEVHP
jgi:hypothetical protein